MRFGWLVEAGVTSNSVLYVKEGVTLGIGTGEQDRVGVAKNARDKAYEKLTDRLFFERLGIPYNEFFEQILSGTVEREALEIGTEIEEEVAACQGGLEGSIMVSDAFFPFVDGVNVGLRVGVKAIIQPGGSERDFDIIDACNRDGATMVFTGKRSFKH